MTTPKLIVYEARDGWRWRLKATNGRIIADSGEAYTRFSGVRRAVKAFLLMRCPKVMFPKGKRW